MREWTEAQRAEHGRKISAGRAKRRAGGRGGRIVITRPGRTAKATPLTMEDLPQLLKAHELVERMGWKVATAVADAVGPRR